MLVPGMVNPGALEANTLRRKITLMLILGTVLYLQRRHQAICPILVQSHLIKRCRHCQNWFNLVCKSIQQYAARPTPHCAQDSPPRALRRVLTGDCQTVSKFRPAPCSQRPAARQWSTMPMARSPYPAQTAKPSFAATLLDKLLAICPPAQKIT